MLLLNKLKKVIICSAIFFSILFLNGSNYAIVSPTKDFYVNDYANLLSEETKKYILQTNQDLNQKTGAQIVIVTVKNLEGKSIEEYANQLFREFGIGDKEKNNGLLLLCSYEDRMFRVEVGYGLEGCLPDGKTGRLQDEYIIPYLRENKFDEGIRNGYSAFLGEVAEEYNITIDRREEATIKITSTQFVRNITLGCYSGLIVGIIIRIYMRKGNKKKGLIAYGITIIISFIVSFVIFNTYSFALMYFVISGLGIISSGRGRIFYHRWTWKIWRIRRRIVWRI